MVPPKPARANIVFSYFWGVVGVAHGLLPPLRGSPGKAGLAHQPGDPLAECRRPLRRSWAWICGALMHLLRVSAPQQLW